MSAEILRRAAALVRGNAEGAQHFTSPWFVTSSSSGEAGVGYSTGHAKAGHLASLADYASATTAPEHIASWHPAVALAVAEWLDAHADVCSSCEPGICYALSVARAYLGAAS